MLTGDHTMTGPPLRERMKQQTRQLIAETAFSLFAERGFEGVPVAEIARQAGVSEATVFNYFPAKEDLIYSGMQGFEADLLAAVRDRRPGQPVLDAVRAYLLTRKGLLADSSPEAGARLRTLSRIVTASPALRSRERQIYDEATGALADLIAAETSAGPDAVEPWVIANALTGVHRALVGYVRSRILAGADPAALAEDTRSQTRRAFAALEQDLSQGGGDA
jgi:AcrR family transcriptional regulator